MLHVLLLSVSGPKQSALALHEPHEPTKIAPFGNNAEPAGTVLTLLHRSYMFPPLPTVDPFQNEQPVTAHVQLLSKIEIVPGDAVVELKVMLFLMQVV